MLTPSTRLTEAISSPNLTYSIEVKKPISSKIRSTEHTKPFLANPTFSTSWATSGKRGALLRQGGLRLFHYPLKTENLNKLFLFLERYLGYFSHLATVTK